MRPPVVPTDQRQIYFIDGGELVFGELAQNRGIRLETSTSAERGSLGTSRQDER